MYQDTTNKQYPATFTTLCVQPRDYNITTRKGVTNRKTQAPLRLYQPQSKKSEDESSGEQSSDMRTLKQADTLNNQVQPYSWPKRDIKLPQLYLIYEILSE